MARSNTELKFFPNFVWAIPRSFTDPLSTCRFEQGDTLYENKSAYLKPWSEVQKSAGRAIQILSPSKGVTSKSLGKDDSSFAENWQQEVVFDLYDLKAGTSQKLTSTEGRLYTFLWLGDSEILDENKDSPPVLRQASALKKLLPDAAELFQTELLPDPNLTHFLLPCDLAAGLYRDKYLNVKARLESEFETTVKLESAGNLGGKQPFLPTVHVAIFSMRDTSPDLIEKALQDVLYRPLVGRKGVSRFRLKTHGLLI